MAFGSTTVSRDRLKAELEAFRDAQVMSASATEKESILTRIHGTDAAKKTYSPEFVAFILNDLMVDAAIIEEVGARKLTPKATVSASARADLAKNFNGEENYAKIPKLLRDRLEKRQLLFDALVANTSAGAGDPKTFFEKNKNNYANVCASHILVATEQEAKAIQAELAKGGDFAALAKGKSTDTGSGAEGGELGCTSPSTYVPEFAAATIAQPLNEVGAPVKSQFGFHLIKVTKRTDATFEDVKTQIESDLSAASEKALSDKLIERLKSTKITVDPNYAKFELAGDRGFPQIVAKTTQKAPAVPEAAASSVAASS